MSQPTREQRIAGYRALAELGVDVSQAMTAEGWPSRRARPRPQRVPAWMFSSATAISSADYSREMLTSRPNLRA